jgi:hypothetical protein
MRRRHHRNILSKAQVKHLNVYCRPNRITCLKLISASPSASFQNRTRDSTCVPSIETTDFTTNVLSVSAFPDGPQYINRASPVSKGNFAQTHVSGELKTASPASYGTTLPQLSKSLKEWRWTELPVETFDDRLMPWGPKTRDTYVLCVLFESCSGVFFLPKRMSYFSRSERFAIPLHVLLLAALFLNCCYFHKTAENPAMA